MKLFGLVIAGYVSAKERFKICNKIIEYFVQSKMYKVLVRF